MRHIRIINALIEVEPQNLNTLKAEAFEVAQLARASTAGAAVAQIFARFASGNDALAEQIRRRQDAVERWQALEANLIGALSKSPEKRNKSDETKQRLALTELGSTISTLDAQFSHSFPEYAALASPEPMKVGAVQSLLREAEALLVYSSDRKQSYLWTVRHDRIDMAVLPIGREELSDAVSDLRIGLDSTDIQDFRNIPTYSTARAYRLYQKILEPAEPHLVGATHVFVVPDSALQSLPLGVLVTDKPQVAITDFTEYREVPWLAKRYAMTVLPSVSSLGALRNFSKSARAAKPFIGIGDPVLDGHGGDRRGFQVTSLLARGGGGLADPTLVKQLPALPETADELHALAASLGAGSSSLYLAENATEEKTKSIDMTDSRVIAFATHGLMAGDFEGLGEPALVLMPPDKANPGDDGLLTASEVAQLKLNADWVILSACNTAAPDGTPGAEGLSGLARAFFYAGSRALLVSHWPVNTEAAVKLTTRMLAMTAADPRVGRSEALRRSRLALMDGPDKPYYAHPMFWAPFVVVGESGAVQLN